MLARRLHCSFCGKDETQVSKLVAGPRVYICDACVATAKRIMDESDGGGHPGPAPRGSRWRSALRRILGLGSRAGVQRQGGAAALHAR